jgi:hypothetical protein
VLRLPTLVLALVLGTASAVHAQNAACPNTSMMTFTSAHNGAVLNVRDGAKYAIWLGRTTNSAGNLALAALIMRNEVCLTGHWVKDGAGATSSLTTNTNLCLGSGSDIVQVLAATTPISFCGFTFNMNAFAYGGRTLATYSGGGHDMVFGGSGRDHIFGGSGSDIVFGGSGSADELYGESSNDIVHGSKGSATYSSGGTLDDVVADDQGSNDSLYGGDGTDVVTSTCNSSFLFCGGIGDGDVAISPDPEPPGTLCEEWQQKLNCE